MARIASASIQRKSWRCGSCSRLAGLELDARLAGVGVHFAADNPCQQFVAAGQGDLGQAGRPEHAESIDQHDTQQNCDQTEHCRPAPPRWPKPRVRRGAKSACSRLGKAVGAGRQLDWSIADLYFHLLHYTRPIQHRPMAQMREAPQNRPNRFRSRCRTNSAAVFTVNVNETGGPHTETGPGKVFRRRAPRESRRRCWPRASACR